ncbi:MAG: hypothetical protein RLZZ312_1223 [Bacteroidota bacterium]|jgi:hypothetical protein
MYSKQQNQQLKQRFWIAFANQYPRKWLLYNTKIKDFSFKFFVDNKMAQISIDIEQRDANLRKIYFQKIESLKTILENDFIQGLVFEQFHTLESGKTISRIFIQKDNTNIGNENYWHEIFDFFNKNMDSFERFFYEYEDYIRDLETNV